MPRIAAASLSEVVRAAPPSKSSTMLVVIGTSRGCLNVHGVGQRAQHARCPARDAVVPGSVSRR